MNRQKRHTILFTTISLVVTAGIFAYLFSHITLQDVTKLLTGISLPLLIAFLSISLSMQLVRTVRYRIILAAAGEHPRFFRLFLVVLVRGLCVDLLPARAGELIYIYLLRSRLAVEIGAATSSFALAFLFDMMAMAPLLLIMTLAISTGTPMSIPALAGIAVILLAASAFLIHALPGAAGIAANLARRLPAKWPRLRSGLIHLLESTRLQVIRARSSGIYLKVFVLSIAVRIMKYAGLYVLLLAMLLPHAYTVADLSFPRVFLGLTASEAAASLPVSGIAGLGAYQGAWSLVFTLLGFDPDMAKATSISHHLISQLNGYSLGIAAMLALTLMRPVRRKDEADPVIQNRPASPPSP